jgi:DNA polymerase I
MTLWHLYDSGLWHAHWHAQNKDAANALEKFWDELVTLERFCDHLLVFQDSSSKRRLDLFPDYKGNRPPKDDDLVEALRDTNAAVARRFRTFRVFGYEADDLIATAARKIREHDFRAQIRISAGDKDIYQLIEPNVKVVRRSREEVTEEEVFQKFGVRPAQMHDFLAITGDSSDNIPGCPKVGMGKAAVLLNRFGTLAAIKQATPEELRSLPGIGPVIVENILAWDPTLSLELVRLDDEAPIKDEELFGVKP